MITHAFPAMGGSVEVQLPDGSSADAVRIEALFATHEHVLSRFLSDSELTALNDAISPFHASPLLFEAVSEALGWACVTDGVFDPTVIDVLESSGYDRPFDSINSPAAVAMMERPASRRASWRAIELDTDRNVITIPATTRLDLGGIGKGFTVDRAVASLGPTANAMINASGDLYAAGDGPDGDGWYVGVQDPFSLDLDLAVLNLNDCGVATSGSIKRKWLIGDARYHHLIDARAGISATSDLLTVTVVAATATQSDVLAKTAFLLGARAGVNAVERFDGAECLAVTCTGDVVTSSGMAEHYA